MTEKTLKEKAISVLSRAFRGEHNIPGKIIDDGNMVFVSVLGGISTYDSNVLTTLVIASHEECVRLAITYSGPLRIKLQFTNRIRSSRSINKYHPTIDEAVQSYRSVRWTK